MSGMLSFVVKKNTNVRERRALWGNNVYIYIYIYIPDLLAELLPSTVGRDPV